ncbi:MAG TPA: AEC family transporter [Propioniciclava tarda]|nr:AEC family transporter [Propioniciclava tarda]
MVRALTEVILPVILVAGLGAFLARTFTIDQTSTNKIQLFGLVPALAFSSIMKTQLPMGQVVGLGVAYLATSLAIGLVAWVAARGIPAKSRGPVIACAVVGNNGNFGLPIALLALGQAGLDQAVVIFLFSIVLMWTVGPVLLGSHGGPRAAVLAIVRLPALWAMAAALVLKATNLTLPVGVNAAVELVAQACIPMVLLSLGVQLGSSKRIHVTRPVLLATALRVVVLPLLAWGVGRLVGLSGLPLQSLVLACAMPTAVNIAMIALEYSEDADTVASEVALSTLLSIGTLAIVVTNLPVFA